MMFNKDQDYWAGCYSTKEFLLIETYSGLGMVGSILYFPAIYLHRMLIIEISVKH
ncbi:hypothetical protein O185_23505 [Photorhabdus temperata J3]|uniref:Uncharacterized protein n=1 Tax=Photorhabdus temperata J3 TaxID=1389415 RepID=U7QW40_PHOTE|nr:hypothetical protein O185_23505 [Photorhabdus temperata J3]